MDCQARGKSCEDLALQHYLSRSFQLIRRRWKSPFAEIDLVLRAPTGEIVLVEVKSLKSVEYLHVRISRRQKQRLQRALIFSAERRPGTRMELAVVSQQGLVETFSDFFD